MPTDPHSLTDAAASMLGACQGALGQVVWQWVNEKGSLDGDAREFENRVRSKLHEIDAATVAAGSLGPELTDFGGALAALKAGKRVARAGWNGKGMWLALTPPRKMSPSPVGPQHDGAVGALIRADDPSWVEMGAHIDMRAADGTLVIGWLASQTDMLATDWQILD